jgi:hypothetical protein
VSCFCIDACFDATMSNHLHIVLRVLPRLAKRMADKEVARRWLRVFPGKRVLDGNWVEPTEKEVERLANDKKRLDKIRRRLGSISWFMGALCEYIARRANHEEGKSGRFWEGRFGCREITDEAGLLVCGIYVDLNQIRAGEASRPEDSQQCSVWYRLRAYLNQRHPEKHTLPADYWLAPLTIGSNQPIVPAASGLRACDRGLLDMSFEKYLQTLEWVGQQGREGKLQGKIPSNVAPILERLGIQPDMFVLAVNSLPALFKRVVGPAEDLRQRAKRAGRRWFQGVRAAAKVFQTLPDAGKLAGGDGQASAQGADSTRGDDGQETAQASGG